MQEAAWTWSLRITPSLTWLSTPALLLLCAARCAAVVLFGAHGNAGRLAGLGQCMASRCCANIKDGGRIMCFEAPDGLCFFATMLNIYGPIEWLLVRRALVRRTLDSGRGEMYICAVDESEQTCSRPCLC